MEYMECDFDCDNVHKMEVVDFIFLTNTSEDFANDYLNSNEWNLEMAVNNFFESGISEIEINTDKSFKVISWNLDGLDERHIDARTKSFLNVIEQNQPDFVFLQELINSSEAIMRSTLAYQYDFFIDTQQDSYYCGILVKKTSSIKVTNGLNIFRFNGSQMGRRLLSVTVEVFGQIDMKLMTSHLESMKDYSEERKSQLSTSFGEMMVGASYSIFAGDMNVRDFELRQIGSPPNTIVDVCETLCSKSKEMATWEPSENKNISRTLSSVPGMRFDRMYFCNSVAGNLRPTEFSLLGKDVLTECDLHTSDHWAIHAVFSL